MASSLPSGRILYRGADEQPFVVLLHEPTRGLYVAPDGWDRDTLVAGPFDEHDALRAWRLANVRVTDGCERGPWQWGIGLLERRRLPFPAEEWSAFEASWLAPGVTVYADADADRVVNEACCGAPRDEPRVRRGEARELAEEVSRALQGRVAEVDIGSAGTLERQWNVHPRGSVVLRRGRSAAAAAWDFLVVDLAPTTVSGR